MTEKKIKTIFYAYGLNISAKLLDIAFFLFLVRVIAKDDLGILNTTMALSAIFYVLLDGGLVESTFRSMAEGTAQLRPTALGASLHRIGYLAAIFFLLGLLHYTGTIEANYFYGCAAALIFQCLTLWQNLYLNWLKANSRQSKANTILLLESISKLFLIIGIAQTDAATAVWVWGLYILGKLPVLLGCFLDSAFKRNWRNAKHELKFNYFVFSGQYYFLVLTSLTILQNRLDWLLLGAYLDQASVATYSVANKFYEIILFVLGVGASTIYPWLLKNEGSEQNKIEALHRIQLYIAVLAVPSTLFVFPYVNSAIWGNRYNDVDQVLRYLLPCVLLAVTNIKLFYRVLILHKERMIIPFTATVTILQALFNFFMISKLGITAAVIGMWLLNFFNVVAFSIMIESRGLWPLKAIRGDIFRSVILSGMLFFICYSAYSFDLLIVFLLLLLGIIFFESRLATKRPARVL